MDRFPVCTVPIEPGPCSGGHVVPGGGSYDSGLRASACPVLVEHCAVERRRDGFVEGADERFVVDDDRVSARGRCRRIGHVGTAQYPGEPGFVAVTVDDHPGHGDRGSGRRVASKPDCVNPRRVTVTEVVCEPYDRGVLDRGLHRRGERPVRGVVREQFADRRTGKRVYLRVINRDDVGPVPGERTPTDPRCLPVTHQQRTVRVLHDVERGRGAVGDRAVPFGERTTDLRVGVVGEEVSADRVHGSDPGGAGVPVVSGGRVRVRPVQVGGGVGDRVNNDVVEPDIGQCFIGGGVEPRPVPLPTVLGCDC